MNDDLYTAPKSDLLVNATGQVFYVVSLKKFLLLFGLTMGVYASYWMYKNWRFYKDATQEQLMPIARGIFIVFFIHSLFDRVQEKASRDGIVLDWNRSSLATGLVVLYIVGNLAGRLIDKVFNASLAELISFGALVPIGILLIKAQAAINAACGDQDGLSNSQFTGANIFWMLLGACLWVLTFIGMMLGPEG